MLPNIKKGDRIELTGIMADPLPVDVGTKGTVIYVSTAVPGEIDIGVKWDNGRTLGLICPIDQFKVLRSES